MNYKVYKFKNGYSVFLLSPVVQSLPYQKPIYIGWYKTEEEAEEAGVFAIHEYDNCINSKPKKTISELIKKIKK